MSQPVITVVDLTNGTGALITVSGTTGGINTASIVQSDRLLQNGWTVTPYSCVGNGSIQIPVGSENVPQNVQGVTLWQAWFVQVTNSETGLTSEPALVTPTQGLTPNPYFQGICALQRAIINLSISGTLRFIGGKVYRCEDPEEYVGKGVVSYPCILLYPPQGGTEKRAASSNQTTTWTFPCGVSLMDNDGSWYQSMEAHSYYRWQSMAILDRLTPLSFNNGQPGTLMRITVQTGPIIERVGKDFQFWHSRFVVNMECERWKGNQIGN